jgi:hypothetical protein
VCAAKSELNLNLMAEKLVFLFKQFRPGEPPENTSQSLTTTRLRGARGGRGARRCSGQRRNFNCTTEDFYCRFIFCFSAFFSLFYEISFHFYGLPSSKIGFLSCFSRPPLHPCRWPRLSTHRTTDELSSFLV